jgi:hypothetical protein
LFGKNTLKHVVQCGTTCGKFVAISAELLFLTLTSCGSSDPDCGSSATQDLIVQIAKEHRDNKLINYAVSNSKSVQQSKQDASSLQSYVSRMKIIQEESRALQAQQQDEVCRRIEEWKRQHPPDMEESRALQAQIPDSNIGIHHRQDVKPYIPPRCVLDITRRDTIESIAFKKGLGEYNLSVQQKLSALTNEYNELQRSYLDEQNKIAKKAEDKAKEAAVYTLDTIRMNSKDADTKAVSCAAKLNVQIEGGGAQMEINYKVEKTTDGKLYATVYGL